MAETKTPPVPPAELVDGLSLPSWRTSETIGAAEEQWRNGLLWAYAGRYDRAWAWWDRITDPAYAARIRAARAQTLRDLALHERAEAEDRAGLAVAARQEDRAGLLIGFVADAIGLGNGPEARHRFRQASRELALLGESVDAEIERIRFGWVAAEIQLLTGEGATLSMLPSFSDDREQVMIPERYEVGGEYHLAKGLLFAGVLTRDVELLEEAAVRAPPGLAWAVHLARESMGVEGALAEARAAWKEVVPPPRHAPEAGRTSTALRLAR
ncbi:MAG: hypothetical protein KY469_02515 [Actinobacteria bacterium]|nr:hypothetical protein [Actinomycetota bacterium]